MMKKFNVYKKLKVGILLLVVCLHGSVQSYEHFGEVQERGVLVALEGMRSFQVHYTNWLFYTINVGTPGFIETGVYNSRVKKPDGLYGVDYKPFFRWRAGPIRETGNELDVYIDAHSRGFFIVNLGETVAFTRDGRFRLDSKRRLVTLSGYYPVLGEEGEIILPEGDDILISRSGLIFVDGQPVTRLKIVVFQSFKDMQTLESLNGSFFVPTKELATLEGPEHYAILQGFLEENNVLKAISGDIGMGKNGYDTSVKTAHLINRALSTASGIIGQ